MQDLFKTEVLMRGLLYCYIVYILQNCITNIILLTPT